VRPVCHNLNTVYQLKLQARALLKQRTKTVFSPVEPRHTVGREGSDRLPPPRPVGYTARGAEEAAMANEYAKENLTGRGIFVYKVMADDGGLILTSGPFSCSSGTYFTDFLALDVLYYFPALHFQILILLLDNFFSVD
jgi:hypothetical protein